MSKVYSKYSIKLIPKLNNVYYADIDGVAYALPLVNRYKQKKLILEQIRILNNNLYDFEKLLGVKPPLKTFKEVYGVDL